MILLPKPIKGLLPVQKLLSGGKERNQTNTDMEDLNKAPENP